MPSVSKVTPAPLNSSSIIQFTMTVPCPYNKTLPSSITQEILQSNQEDYDIENGSNPCVYLDADSNTAVVVKKVLMNEVLVHQNLPSNCPYLVKMLRFEEDGEDEYKLVLEYCSGGDLFDLVQSSCLSSCDTQVFMQQISSGLLQIHNAGFAHRDLSLENILLNDDQSVAKIADFGLACDANEASNEVVGKWFYMAPEVARGDTTELRYDPRAADMWSLGIMLFIMLIGSPPFSEATTNDSRYAYFLRNNGSVQELLSIWGFEVPDPLALDLLEKLLRPNPNERLRISQVLSHPYI